LAVYDEALRVTLKDERLQRVLTEIDSSSNREKVNPLILQRQQPEKCWTRFVVQRMLTKMRAVSTGKRSNFFGHALKNVLLVSTQTEE